MKRAFSTIPAPGALTAQLRSLATHRNAIKVLAKELSDKDLLALREITWSIYFPFDFELRNRRDRLVREQRKKLKSQAARDAKLKLIASPPTGGPDAD